MSYKKVPFHGRFCQIEWDDITLGYTKGWNINVILDTERFSISGRNWKEALPGQAGWSGSLTMYCVPEDARRKAIDVIEWLTGTDWVADIEWDTPYDSLMETGKKLTTCKFTLDDRTSAFVGDFFATRISINAAPGGIVMLKVDFKGDGALSLTDAA